MTVAAARARTTSLRSTLEDPPRIAAEKRRVITRLLEASPRIAEDGVTRFWVEPVAGRGSLDAWCALARRILADHRPVSIGVGPTATVAWAAARGAHDGVRLVSADDAGAFLDEAPIEALEIPTVERDILAALGVRTVGQLRRASAGSLSRRLGPAVAEARRRAEGHDLRSPRAPRLPSRFDIELTLDDEITALEPLLFLLRPALERLGAALSREGVGATELLIVTRHSHGPEQVHTLRTSSPVFDAHTLQELARTHLERVRFTAPVSGVRVAAGATSRAERQGPDLFRARGRDPAAREVALGRLRARFGDGAVKRAARRQVGPALERATYRLDAPREEELIGPTSPALPWRKLEPPAGLEGGAVFFGGRRRRLVRLGRVERANPPWWETGVKRVQLLAWAELEGPVLVLLRARVSTACDDEWEVVAWVD